ncbi:Cellulose biosynthesis protein BcsR [Burkholderia sp. WP9]|uniref:cellulose biosynthesis protein BcsP n=1 Tax=Burkholderia sp. WP9 TaxID=1500263 RepID=UPI0008987D34|nr:cellulose biosynthesis protein BcsP [Burkholderia sp. WP9]SEE83426.1 Cellulose biosynthesis protein BcsR [Burkholderia sp. WP9]
MSSSSDIEKLFDHFGGDANAYQEIGRENEARSARTRWPLLVTLDLTQPTIPAIGQRREAKPQSPVAASPVAVDRQDTTPKDAASVTRAKAPLFTRSHRRDIPPVAVAAPASTQRGASRFGELESKVDAAPLAVAGAARVGTVAAQASPAAFVAPVAVAPVSVAPISADPVSAAPASAFPASVPPVIALRTPIAQTIPSVAPSWAHAPAPVRAYTSAPLAPSAPSTLPAATAPAAPTQQAASILGKLFAPEPEPTPPQPDAASGESAPLQGIFDRLRGAPAQTAAAPASATSAAAPRTSNSWLVNGPRRS